MDGNILEALKAIPVADLDREKWIEVGMALKHEGYDCSAWDEWSKNDARYHDGECSKKWRSFKGSSTPVTGGSIIDLGKKYGWKPFGGNMVLDWNDPIEYDGDEQDAKKDGWNPAQDIITFLETIFEPNETIGYVTESWKGDDNKWHPKKGVYSRTAGQIINELKKHPDNIEDALGSMNAESGVWIRFNPLDGKGVSDDNVTRYTYALVESDTMPVEDQYAMIRKLELPVATLVHSGGKSLHALVRVDATNEDEYRKRTETLYDYLDDNGLKVDRQNRNPSRLSRMPGVMRSGNRQYLVATNIGRKSWTDWMDFVEDKLDELPEAFCPAELPAPPVLPEPLIDGILRCGHKLLISGASKAGKSFLLMQLGICIATGRDWLGFKCKKGKVFYINLEIDGDSATNRFFTECERMKLDPKDVKNFELWNLRGHALPLDKLVPKLVRRIKDKGYIAVIIDPIYKVITGDENNASDMGAFCNQFDKICDETGAASIYCHHHSKGAQGGKHAMDRASGSGVFARDPDAQLDLIQLELTDEAKELYGEDVTAWRMESSLREFKNIKPVNMWFDWPLHIVDTTGTLDKMYAEGDPKANLTKSGNRQMTDDDRIDAIEDAYNKMIPPVKLTDLCTYLSNPKTHKARSEKTVRDWITLHGGFNIVNGVVLRK